MKRCDHPFSRIRPAIGPDSGILCGLCGQDVPAPLVFAIMLDQMRDMSQKIHNLTQLVGATDCTHCGRITDASVQFYGIKNQSLCIGCLEAWFDNEDGNVSDMNVGYLAEFMLRHDIRVSGHRSRLAEMALQVFPDELPRAIKARMR